MKIVYSYQRVEVLRYNKCWVRFELSRRKLGNFKVSNEKINESVMKNNKE
jgi:hypothetical protein